MNRLAVEDPHNESDSIIAAMSSVKVLAPREKIKRNTFIENHLTVAFLAGLAVLLTIVALSSAPSHSSIAKVIINEQVPQDRR